MPAIKLSTFKGEVPAYAPHLLPSESSTKALDCKFDGGELVPMSVDLDTGETAPADTVSMFRYEGQYWFTWNIDVDAVKSPVANDSWRRVYWTDGVYPKVTYNTIFNGGGPTIPTNSYRLGVPAPTVAPVVTSYVQSDDPVNEVTVFYVTTYSTAVGEEGMPGPVSAELTCFPIGVEKENPDGSKTLSEVVLELQPPGTNISNIERINIYRTATSAGGSEFLRVASVPISQASYTDSKKDEELTNVLETTNYAMPPDEMIGLCVMANGICAGFMKNELLFSEAYLPYAWPEEYRLSIEEDIIAIEPIGTSLVVGTTGDPYLYTGVSPGNIAGQRLEIAQACVSKRSMVNVGMAVIYASPDGLVAVAPDGITMVTGGIIDPPQWKELVDPSTIDAYRYEGKYIAVHSKGAFIFDPINKDLRHLSSTWKAAYTDPKDESIYFVSGTNVMKFQGGSDVKELTWKSKEFDAVSQSFSCVRIDSEGINQIGFKYFVDGVEVMTRVPGALKQTFTLPSIRGDVFQFEISSKSNIKTVRLATSKQELKL